MSRFAGLPLGTLERYRVLEMLGSGQLAAGSEVRAFGRAARAVVSLPVHPGPRERDVGRLARGVVDREREIHA